MNKQGKITAGVGILIALALVAIYTMNIAGVQDFLKPSVPIVPVVGRCPSSGLTEVTLNTQEALASTATNANVTYFAFDGSTLVKNGETGTDGTVSFDLACGVGKTYQLLVFNDKTTTGYYPKTVTVDASGPIDIQNMKVYEHGAVDIASIVSSTDPTGNGSIKGGTGKVCGYTITFSENESASAFNKPLIVCHVNSTSVIDMTMSGVTEVPTKKPTRLTSVSGHQYYVFEYDKLLKSTDGAVKLSGALQFSASASILATDTNNMSCIVIDQATYKVSEYKTMSLSEGFLEAAENRETVADIGALDATAEELSFNGHYC